ncbi:MAG TPA: hypothetical protein VMM76_08860, partial [Pirellulaceae bacterium]|nr:hypothetical protein [Pirellulaceae bacterium]HUG67850.1 hypothetical protein [Pirellulaceae bacterium]
AAAIYSSWHEPTHRARNMLRELSTRDDYDQNAPLPFNGYGWAGFARQQLAHVWGDAVEVG